MMLLKKLFLPFLCWVVLSANISAQSGRTAISLDFGWFFHAGDVADGASPLLDDSGWRNIDLPHDFQIEQP